MDINQAVEMAEAVCEDNPMTIHTLGDMEAEVLQELLSHIYDLHGQIFELGLEVYNAKRAIPMNCPDCPDRGYITHCSIAGGYNAHQRCDWCHGTPNSVFNLNKENYDIT